MVSVRPAMARLALLYGTRGRQVLMHDDMEPALAAALARAHNDWTREYCAADPRRLKFAAQVAFHDPALAAAEARRAVRELGAVAVVGNPNPIDGRHVHDPVFEPLWDAVEGLGVPVGFHPTGISSLRDDIARRYLDHLCQLGRAELAMRYGGPGRPEHRYRLLSTPSVR